MLGECQYLHHCRSVISPDVRAHMGQRTMHARDALSAAGDLHQVDMQRPRSHVCTDTTHLLDAKPVNGGVKL